MRRARSAAWAVSALILGAACREPAAPASPGDVLAIAVDSVPNSSVRAVTVQLDRAAPVSVTYGAPGTPVLSLRADTSATTHRFLLPRLRPNRSYVLEAFIPGDGDSPLRTSFLTGILPTALASVAFTVTGTPSLPVALVELVGAVGFGGLLMVEEGTIVGWLPVTGSLFGATRRANGEFVLLDAVLGLVSYRIDGMLVHRLPQPDATTITPYERIHHDVVATPTNTLLFIANETRVVASDTVVGEALWEWAPASGAVTKRWSAFDHLDWATLRGSRSVAGNWLHGNGLNFGPRGNVLMSLRNADQVISIAPGYASVEWTLGGTTGTLAVSAADRFLGQHYVSEPTAGRVLVYDNGWERPGGTYTRAIEYAINTSAATATKVWEYRHTPEIYASLVGSARRLPNGNTTILFGMLAGQNFSTGPVTAVEVDPVGNVVWRLSPGPQLTRVYRVTPVASVAGEQPGAFLLP